MVTCWKQGRSECPSEAVVILVFHIDNCLLGPYGCWKWDVRAPSQWLISCDVQPEGLHSVDRPPRPSLCPLFEQLQEVGDGFIKSPFDFAGLEKGLLLVVQPRVCVLLTTVWVVLPRLDLECKLKLIPLRTKISSLSLSWIRGSTSCIKALTSKPEGWPSEISICQPHRKLPITHGVL